jgi:NAD+ kinase
VVREPYQTGQDCYQLITGLLEPGEDLRIWSKIADGRIYVDGPHQVHPVPFGAELRMTESQQPLILLGLDRHER